MQGGDNAYSPGPYDQRGAGYSRIIFGRIDIGAYEAQFHGGRDAATVQGNATNHRQDSAGPQPTQAKGDNSTGDASDAFFATYHMKGDPNYLNEMQF
jgi:hypothetical protein